MKTANRPRGRPPKDDSMVQIAIRLPAAMLAFVDSTVFKAAPCAAGARKKSKALLKAARAKSSAKAAAG